MIIYSNFKYQMGGKRMLEYKIDCNERCVISLSSDPSCSLLLQFLYYLTRSVGDISNSSILRCSIKISRIDQAYA